MAPNVERSGKNSPKSKLLTMDVIELTLLLKSIGFRLESIDYDEFRCWNKKFSEHGNVASTTTSASTATATSTTAPNSNRPDVDQHYINVQISCSKSKIVSNLSLKFNDSDATVLTDTQQPMTEPSKTIACSCPKREPRYSNNSFWEVQSSGTFSNQRRSINSLMNPDTGIDHDTSSNLLPILSTKSIALTHVLTQVLLNQYKNNTQFGELSAAKDVDIKSIMRTIESTNIASILANGKVADGGNAGHIHDLNLITPMSSMNVTPTEPEALMNVTVPKLLVNDQTAALNDTVNTEAFTSPKSDMFTSSPQGNDETNALTNERDSNIINHLYKARQSIDQAILSMKLNVTRSLAQDVTAIATGPLSVTIQELPNDSNQKRFIAQQSRMLNGRNASQAIANARPPLSALNRRASLGSIGIGRMASKSIVASPAITSRLNTSRPNSVDRPAATTSKMAMVRKAVSGIGKAVTGSNSSIAAKTQSTQVTIKRAATMSRRTSSPAMISTGNITPTKTGSANRKTAATSKISLVPSKLVKK